MKSIHVDAPVVEFEGRVSYPWKVWADGKSRKLTHGKHFHTDPRIFVIMAHNWARRNKMKVRCRTISETDVLLQFTKR